MVLRLVTAGAEIVEACDHDYTGTCLHCQIERATVAPAKCECDRPGAVTDDGRCFSCGRPSRSLPRAA